MTTDALPAISCESQKTWLSATATEYFAATPRDRHSPGNASNGKLLTDRAPAPPPPLSYQISELYAPSNHKTRRTMAIETSTSALAILLAKFNGSHVVASDPLT